MFKTIVASVILFLFVLQANHLLFADEHPKAEAEVSAATAEVSAEVSTATTEVSAEESTTAVAETVETVEAVVEEAVSEVSAEAVVEKAVEVATEVVTTAVAEAEVTTGTVVEEKAEATAEEAAPAVAETQTATEEIATIVEEAEVTTEAVLEKVAEAATEVITPAVAVAETKPEETVVAVAEQETDVIAVINGEKLLRHTFDKRLNVFRRMNQEVTDAIKMQVVDQLTKKILLKQFVEKQEISAGAEDIQAEIEKIKFFLQNNPANKDKPLEEILETQGSSVTELEDEVSRALALSKYLENLVTDADKKSYFDANKNAFNGARVMASHVLIDTRNLKTDAELEEAKKKIDDVKTQIDNGADFAEMAKKYSNCPSAENDGDIGFFQRKGSIVEEFAQVAFAMKIGEISEPIKTQFGYHIIKVTDKEEGKDVKYADVADMVDFVYMQIKTESLLKELHDKAEIKMML
jgi:parvulin-like peptidyl-prolyl isomerase